MAIEAEQRYYMKLKAACYYYEKNLTQAEIAARLNVSRITLGRLLREAREEGLVQIKIVDHRNISHCLEAEEAIKERFGLRDVRIVDCILDSDDAAINLQIGAAAARYFEQLLKSGMRIGIGWGRTLEHMIHSLHKDKSIENLEVITLLGGASTVTSMIQPNMLAQTVLEKYGGRGYIINAPYICQTEQLCATIKAEPGVSTALEKSLHADILITGIGEQPSKTPRYHAYYDFDDSTVDMLLQNGAVGDICAHFFDAAGGMLNSPVCRRVVSIDPEDIRTHPCVMLMGGGSGKHRAILGVLRGGYPDILITDYSTAQAVLQLLQQEE